MQVGSAANVDSVRQVSLAVSANRRIVQPGLLTVRATGEVVALALKSAERARARAGTTLGAHFDRTLSARIIIVARRICESRTRNGKANGENCEM
jgi:hypothetical protein